MYIKHEKRYEKRPAYCYDTSSTNVRSAHAVYETGPSHHVPARDLVVAERQSQFTLGHNPTSMSKI